MSPPSLAASRAKVLCSRESAVQDRSILPSEMDPLEPPAFLKMLGEFIHSSNVKLSTSINGQLTQMNTRLTEIARSTAQNTQAISELRTGVRSLRSEIRFSGVPTNSGLSDHDLVMSALTAMRCVQRVGTILDIRKWNDTPASRPNNAPQRQRAPQNIESLVAKFASPTVRDSVLSKASALKDKTVQIVFGTGGPSRINLSPILPPSVYEIWCSALIKRFRIHETHHTQYDCLHACGSFSPFLPICPSTSSHSSPEMDLLCLQFSLWGRILRECTNRDHRVYHS
ncbi:hypothetical protein QAD02_008365 [Eretmocerus hayati]|uniref:Uncharacterized protein n=1 Tax=Eretmocerus hayati TaxID=131215 RepID=A0ACC2N6W0_9HYME|nr:hypothetical protein QAD02_008365 [Eretmocerus hayati]